MKACRERDRTAETKPLLLSLSLTYHSQSVALALLLAKTVLSLWEREESGWELILFFLQDEPRVFLRRASPWTRSTPSTSSPGQPGARPVPPHSGGADHHRGGDAEAAGEGQVHSSTDSDDLVRNLRRRKEGSQSRFWKLTFSFSIHVRRRRAERSSSCRRSSTR